MSTARQPLASLAVPDEPQLHVNINIPEGMHGGVFADLAMVWHNQNGFTIDFVAPMHPASPDNEGKLQQAATVVARVRLPVSVMFQVARAISENVSQYEARYGKIPAGGPDHPPEEQG